MLKEGQCFNLKGKWLHRVGSPMAWREILLFLKGKIEATSPFFFFTALQLEVLISLHDCLNIKKKAH